MSEHARSAPRIAPSSRGNQRTLGPPLPTPKHSIKASRLIHFTLRPLSLSTETKLSGDECGEGEA